MNILEISSERIKQIISASELEKRFSSFEYIVVIAIVFVSSILLWLGGVLL